MGIFSNFTGGKSRSDARGAFARNQAALDANRSVNTRFINDQFGQGIDNIDTFSDRARDDINTGFGNAFDFLDQGVEGQRDDLTGGFANAEAASEDFLQRSHNLLDPFLESGQRAQTRSDDAIGLNGAEAQQAFYDDFQQNPQAQYIEQQAQRQLNARGAGAGGRAASVAARVQREGIADQQNRLASQGARGGAYAQYLSGLTNQTGANITGLRRDLGTGLSNIEGRNTQLQANLAQNQGTSLANITSNQGANRGNAINNRFNALQNLENNRTSGVINGSNNLANALSGTRSAGLQNTIGLAGTALSLATPGAFGTSALGNIANGISQIGGGFDANSRRRFV